MSINQLPRSGMSVQTDLLARDEYGRCWRLFEHGPGGVAEEQLVARAAAHPHDDQVVPALLHLGEDRLVWRHVGMHGGSCRHVVAVGHFDAVPPDRLLLLAGAETSPPSALFFGRWWQPL